MTRNRLAAGLFAFLIPLALGACGDSDDGNGAAVNDENGAPADGKTVGLKNLEFRPKKITVKAGDTVTWRWQENVLHNVVADEFKSENLSKGTYEHTFDTAGTFDYRCTLHPGMDGEVVVE